VLAGKLREALGVPGLSVEQAVAFRDKEQMKRVIDSAGLRTPWHKSARSADECRAYAEECGFPLIIKPIDGAGSTDTYRVDDRGQLEDVLRRVRHLGEVSLEEYIDGEEFTYDTICANGEILYENVAFYRPKPIEEKKYQWISPSSICVRKFDAPELSGGRELGRAVLKAMGFQTGFSHMEWFLKADGEVVFGEIGARPPGANLVSAMNYASDIDLFTGWAEAVCHGTFSQPVERKYNAAVVCKRAQGSGQIARVEGLNSLLSELGSSVAAVNIRPIGSPVGDWQRAAVSDGWVVVRHPDLQRTLQMVDQVATGLQIYAA
jgi:biotin carboxylase